MQHQAWDEHSALNIGGRNVTIAATTRGGPGGPPESAKIFAAPPGGGEGKEKITQTASLTLYRYSPFSGTKNGVHLNVTSVAFPPLIGR